MSRLVTPSIVMAVEWYKECPESWRDRARVDLVNQLSRVWVDKPASEATVNGVDFENAIYSRARADAAENTRGSEHFRWFVERVRGGEFQRKGKRVIEIDGKEYCLYGKYDVWWPTALADIKTTSKWAGRERYLRGFQSKMYRLIERCARFSYLVAEFEESREDCDECRGGAVQPPDKGGSCGKCGGKGYVAKPILVDHHDVECEPVTDFAALREEVIEKVRWMVREMEREPELISLYDTKFSLY